jgi:hypothetical protein
VAAGSARNKDQTIDGLSVALERHCVIVDRKS